MVENLKLNQIITTSKNLFWKYGTARVTIEEICKESKVSKRTFYKHFKNKQVLIKFILELITNDAIKRYHEIMSKKIPFEEKIRETIQLKIENTKEISREFINDIYKSGDAEILEFMNKQAQQTLKIVLDDYLKAQKNGEIRQDIKPEFIMYFLNNMMEMIKNDKLMQMYSTPQELIIEVTNFFFYGIMPCNNNKQ